MCCGHELEYVAIVYTCCHELVHIAPGLCTWPLVGARFHALVLLVMSWRTLPWVGAHCHKLSTFSYLLWNLLVRMLPWLPCSPNSWKRNKEQESERNRSGSDSFFWNRSRESWEMNRSISSGGPALSRQHKLSSVRTWTAEYILTMLLGFFVQVSTAARSTAAAVGGGERKDFQVS